MIAFVSFKYKKNWSPESCACLLATDMVKVQNEFKNKLLVTVISYNSLWLLSISDSNNVALAKVQKF